MRGKIQRWKNYRHRKRMHTNKRPLSVISAPGSRCDLSEPGLIPISSVKVWSLSTVPLERKSLHPKQNRGCLAAYPAVYFRSLEVWTCSRWGCQSLPEPWWGYCYKRHTLGKASLRQQLLTQRAYVIFCFSDSRVLALLRSVFARLFAFNCSWAIRFPSAKRSFNCVSFSANPASNLAHFALICKISLCNLQVLIRNQ